MGAISDLLMHNDMDADYSPQYVKLARLLRARIESGRYRTGDILRATDLAKEYEVSAPVVLHSLAMLAANRYVHRFGRSASYRVTWQTACEPQLRITAICPVGCQNCALAVTWAFRQLARIREEAPEDGPALDLFLGKIGGPLRISVRARTPRRDLDRFNTGICQDRVE